MLCPTCASLPLDVERPPFGRTGATNVFSPRSICRLGTLGQLVARRCRLCRLICVAVSETQRNENISVDEDQEIGLWWLDDMGPAGGFRLWLQHLGTSRGTMLSFVYNPEVHLSKQPCSYFIPIQESQLDYGRVRRWLAECESDHRPPCYQDITDRSSLASVYPDLRTIRFLDVEDDCLVERRQPCRYVTLSYVWGDVPSFRLSTVNKSRLIKHGAFRDVWTLLPRTIQDAITLTKLLGERYLWVDALCLVQNDPEDVRLGTTVMDLIYEKSFLSIVAACGKDANAGLPGVRPASRFPSDPLEEIKPRLKLAVCTELEYRLESTVYHSRAWTLQEYALSRRSLCFVDDRVYFRCQHAVRSENCIDSMTQTVSKWQLARSTSLSDALLMNHPADYRHLLKHYTQRLLTHQGDVLNALAGIVRRSSEKFRCRFFEGIPTQNFDSGLLFRGAQSSLRRRNGFPSYSWTGWMGRFEFILESTNVFDDVGSDAENIWLYESTWIIWHKRSPSGVVNLVWDPLANEQLSRSTAMQDGHRGRSSFSKHIKLLISTTRTAASELALPEGSVPQYPLLQFWSLSVFYDIVDVDVFKARGTLSDQRGLPCGFIHMDRYEEATFFDRRGPFEFVVLSEHPRKGVPPELLYEWTTWASTRHNAYRPGPKGMSFCFLLMCLEWNDDGIAERRGIGLVLRNFITDGSFPPGPVWKEIVLA